MVANAIAQPATARSERTRAALLDAARQLVETGGFGALTMAAVAQRAGVTRRGAYLHFGSRSELVLALFDHVNQVEGLSDSLQRVWAAPDALDALDEWAAHLARFHPRILRVDLATAAAADQDPDAAAHRAHVAADQRAACRRLAQRLADEGVLAPNWTVESATGLLWAVLASDFLARLLEDPAWGPNQLAARLALLLRGVLTIGAE
jgi:AcrR family transcriptional regulator